MQARHRTTRRRQCQRHDIANSSSTRGNWFAMHRPRRRPKGHVTCCGELRGSPAIRLCAHTWGVCRSSRTTVRTKPILSLKVACCPFSMSSFDELRRRCERSRRYWPCNLIDVSLLPISSLRSAATRQCTFSTAQKSAECIRNISVQITAYMRDSNPDPAHGYFSR